MFHGKKIVSEMEIYKVENDGDEFFHESLISGLPSKTIFSVKRKKIDVYLNYPSKDTSKDLKESYFQKYGPYSIETFVEKARSVYARFTESEKILNNQRSFMRRLWLFKELFELFDTTLVLVFERMSTMVISIYEKSIELLKDVPIKKNLYDAKTRKCADSILSLIAKVQARIMDGIAREPKFLQLMSENLLNEYVTNSSPYMVAKLNARPWIDPITALLAEPNYNFYWTEFWSSIFKRNFKFSDELCVIIAEYMPSPLHSVTFLDYFRKKYSARRGDFFGVKKSFEIKKSSIIRNGKQICNITIVF
uniref:Uncharacterized protein n=1 Tax=viral metagenome TaxID=1070528 RepID=A0A6C0HRH9_9ZZZZ